MVRRTKSDPEELKTAVSGDRFRRSLNYLCGFVKVTFKVHCFEWTILQGSETIAWSNKRQTNPCDQFAVHLTSFQTTPYHGSSLPMWMHSNGPFIVCIRFTCSLVNSKIRNVVKRSHLMWRKVEPTSITSDIFSMCSPPLRCFGSCVSRHQRTAAINVI